MTGLTFLVMFLVLMALVLIVPTLLKRFFVPSVVATILIGIIIGPNSLNLIRHINRILGRGYPTEQLYFFIDIMGLIGLIFLMVLAGLEADLKIIKAEKSAVIWLSLLTFIIPATAGFAVYYYFEPKDFIAQLFYASLFASHSVGIVFPIIRELKIVRTRFGVAVLASTVITDIMSLILLAVCVQLKRHSITTTVAGSISIFDKIPPQSLGPFFIPLFIVSVLFFICFSLWFTPRLSKAWFKHFHPDDDARFTLFFATVLLVVLLGELVGVSVIVGAFIAGMALTSVKEIHAQKQVLFKKLQGAGYGFFIPFLFLSIGMKTDLLSLLVEKENLMIVLLTVTGLIGSKIFSGWLAMRISRFSNIKSWCAGLMTVPQLSATLAAASVGFSLGIIPDNFFNAIVVLSICTTIPVPILLKFIIVKSQVTFDSVDDKLKGLNEEVTIDEDYL